MVGLGVEQAMELVAESNRELRAKLRLVADLSRSAMWDLRHPIDGGQIFRGEALGEVLEAHAATFTVITSVPAEFHRHGAEPDLSTITKSLLFSVAHNALTNVVRHANASRVVIGLDSGGGGAAAVRVRRRRGAAPGLREPGPRVQEHGGRRPADGRSS